MTSIIREVVQMSGIMEGAQHLLHLQKEEAHLKHNTELDLP